MVKSANFLHTAVKSPSKPRAGRGSASKTSHVLPTETDIRNIPLASSGEFELTDKEAAKVRAQIYGLNKDNAAGFKFRTVREGSLLLVWRIR